MSLRATIVFAVVIGCVGGSSAWIPSVSWSQSLGVYANNMPAGSTDLEFDSAGSLFVTGGSGGSGRIYTAPAGGGAASVFVTSGLFRPWGLAFDPGGTLYVADFGDANVANTGKIFRVSSSGTLTIFKSGLNGPAYMLFDAAGNLYVGMFSQNKVIRITPAGVQSDYATGLGVNSGEQVMQISFDDSGNMYAGVEQDIYKIAPGGAPVTKIIAGGLGQAMGHVRLPGDDFIVATFGFHQLRRASPGTAVLGLTNTALASKCTDGPMPNSASVFNPVGMRLRQGRVYFADQGCHDVRAFDAGGVTGNFRQTWGQLKLHYR